MRASHQDDRETDFSIWKLDTGGGAAVLEAAAAALWIGILRTGYHYGKPKRRNVASFFF